jgi:drug/metabolite transporter (DMT)-like permease
MIQSFKEMLITWNADHSERVKLQHTYVVAAVVGIIVAGLVGLLNHGVSQIIVAASLISLGIGLANVLVWALLYSLVIVKLPKARTTRK